MLTCLAAILALLLAQDVAPQVVRHVSPELVREAIAFGSASAAGGKAFAPWRLGSMTVSTPFLRVALAAADAKSKYLKFEPAQVTQEMMRPIVEVDQPGFVDPLANNRSTIDYKHVVVAKGSGPEAEIIQPLTITSTTQTWQSGLGRTLQSHGVRATFPMEVLIPGNEFRVVFANGRESVEKMTDEFLSKIR